MLFCCQVLADELGKVEQQLVLATHEHEQLLSSQQQQQLLQQATGILISKHGCYKEYVLPCLVIAMPTRL